MEYQIPQFIEVEDKIFGPFTFRQFIFIAGGAGLCLFFFIKLPLIVAILLSIPAAALAGALAFYKVNNKSFLSVIEAAVKHYSKGHLYLWRRGDNVSAAPILKTPLPGAEGLQKTPFKTLTRGRLAEIARSLDEEPTRS